MHSNIRSAFDNANLNVDHKTLKIFSFSTHVLPSSAIYTLQMRVSIDFVGREQIKETRQLYRANFSDVQQLVNNFL